MHFLCLLFEMQADNTEEFNNDLFQTKETIYNLN